MAVQYIDTINNLQSTHNKEIEDMKATLDAALLQLKLNNNASGNKGNSVSSNLNYEDVDTNNKAKDVGTNVLIDISSDNDSLRDTTDNSMSGLSVLSSDDNEPIMNGIRCSRRTRMKRVREE